MTSGRAARRLSLAALLLLVAVVAWAPDRAGDRLPVALVLPLSAGCTAVAVVLAGTALRVETRVRAGRRARRSGDPRRR